MRYRQLSVPSIGGGAAQRRWMPVYACPHHPNGKGEFLHPDHPARKPNPGMILRAAADLDLDLRTSWLVGDKTDRHRGRTPRRARWRHASYDRLWRAAVPGLGALTTPNFEVRPGSSIIGALTLPILAR